MTVRLQFCEVIVMALYLQPVPEYMPLDDARRYTSMSREFHLSVIKRR